MKRTALLLALAFGFPSAPLRAEEEAPAPEELMTVGEALTVARCMPYIEGMIPRIEACTRMRFHRPVPLSIMPKSQYEAMRKDESPTNLMRHTVAFYVPGANTMTLIPWAIDDPRDPKKPMQSWIGVAEPVLVHEMTHAIHHQNFHSEGRNYAVSMRPAGLSEEDIDRSTVDFLLTEGVAEWVSLRASLFPSGTFRKPDTEPQGVRRYMNTYKPNGQVPYRAILFENGYQDGMTLMHHLELKGGQLAIRAVLYRPPPRVLFFQPALFAEIDLDDPPEPEPIFQFLHPAAVGKEGVLLAVNPGRDRCFEESVTFGVRAYGCLLGYWAKADNGSEYSFFVANPDNPGSWSEEQVEGLKAQYGGALQEKEATLPLSEGVKAKLWVSVGSDGTQFARAEANGLVVIALEKDATPNLEARVLHALRALQIVKPRAGVYREALEKATKLYEAG